MSLKNLRSKKGFTLIELMIVVAIIGILAAVAIPKFADLVTKSKEASVKANIGAIRSAVSIYYSDQEGEFPANLYNGLTLAGRYMPSSGLGSFAIPKNKYGNTGHTGGNYNSVNSAAAILQDGTLTPTDATQALIYSTGGTMEGEVLVNCSHNDTKGSKWTAF